MRCKCQAHGEPQRCRRRRHGLGEVDLYELARVEIDTAVVQAGEVISELDIGEREGRAVGLERDSGDDREGLPTKPRPSKRMKWSPRSKGPPNPFPKSIRMLVASMLQNMLLPLESSRSFDALAMTRMSRVRR